MHLPALSSLLLCCLVLCTAPAAAQDGTFPGYDVRSRSMGGTGLNATGIDALWTNPAGLARDADRVQASATVEQRFGLSDLSIANAGVAIGRPIGGFGLQLASFGFDAHRENRLGVAYGRRLTDNFSIGAEFAAFGTTTTNYASTFNVTFGLGAQLYILPELRVGARIFSPLRVERLPEEYLPQLLALGVSYRPTKQLLINVEAHQDVDFATRIRSGVEYLPAEELSIRLGIATSATELSFGLGYQIFEGFDLSAGATWHEVLGVWPTVGIRYR